MNNNVVVKTLLLAAFVSVLIVLVCSAYQLRSKAVFCDVGQGDGAYIHTIDHYDIVIDAGPDDAILQCLGRYMPFGDKTIELAIISHPQKDHVEGFVRMMNFYTIETIIMPQIYGNIKSFRTILHSIKAQNSKVIFADATKTIQLSERTSLRIYWPSIPFLRQIIPKQIDTNILGETTKDLNDFSVIVQFVQEGQTILFTGDASPWVLSQIKEIGLQSTVLKVPHHGSINGLTSDFLNKVRPALAVISCGKRNTYGHPSSAIVSMLQQADILIRRTDVEGNIVLLLPESLHKMHKD